MWEKERTAPNYMRFSFSLNPYLTLYHTIPSFNNPEEKAFGKTLWEKEKMLATIIFAFTHNVFTLSNTKLYI